MPTIKLELFKSKTLSDGRHPVCLRVTHGRPVRKTIASATVDEWDSKNMRIKPRSRRDYAKVNSEIEDEYNKYEAVFLTLKKSGKRWNPEDVFENRVVQSPYFLENSELYLKYLESKTIFTHDGAKSIHKKIKDYAEKDFEIDSITVKWLNGFRTFLKNPPYNNSENKIKYDIKYIKRVVKFSGVENKALRDTKITYDEVLKPKLTIEEIENIEKLSFPPGQLYLTRITFLLQFYLWGMRIGDLLLLKHSDIKNGKLHYVSTKTRKEYIITLNDKAKSLLSEFTTGDFLLPWIRWTYNKDLSDFENRKKLNNEIKNRTMIINRNLKLLAKKANITKNLTTHIARHTFAARGDKMLEGNLELLQQMLGHSSRAMTERYVNDLRKSDILDEAAKKIFG